MAGRVGKAIDRLEQMRADAEAEQEPLASPPCTDADPDDPSKEPEPALELEDGEGDPPVTTDQPEFPDPELPHPPQVEQPISVGLDQAKKEVHHGD